MLPNKFGLNKIVKSLQGLLRIQDWDIEIEYVDQYKMKHLFNVDHLDTSMLCERYRLRNEAIIYVNSDHSALDSDWYESIVHELYHIVTGDLSDIADDLIEEIDSPETIMRHKKQYYETTVVRLAKIFCCVYPVTNFDKIGFLEAQSDWE